MNINLDPDEYKNIDLDELVRYCQIGCEKSDPIAMNLYASFLLTGN